MDPTESEVVVGDRVLRIRQAGTAQGTPILYFHGTPGSRLDLAFGDELARRRGCRIISFDRPGYGGSTESAFSLASVARDALAIADVLALGSFSTLGLSGGGPFALATAAVGGDRVARVGVASGGGPFEFVADALNELSDGDKEAASRLPADPGAAALGFASGFEDLARMLRKGDDQAVVTALEPLLSTRDRVIMSDALTGATIIASLREGLSKGCLGGGWDNVAWIGSWDFDLSAVQCPVFLWYGADDVMAPLAHGQWLREHLGNATLIVRDSEGHFGHIDHFSEVLEQLAMT